MSSIASLEDMATTPEADEFDRNRTPFTVLPGGIGTL